MFDKHIHKNEFRLRILLTNQCNKNCHFCLNDFQSKKPPLYLNTFFHLDCLRAYGQFMKSIGKTSIVTFSGGEPGIHPNLDLFLAHARHHCDVVKVVTNGTALNSKFCKFVDCWHVGVTDKDESVMNFLQHAKDITIQIVVTEQESTRSLINLIEYYHKAGLKVKLFTDFYSSHQDQLVKRVNQLADIFVDRISTRFTGKQENRGKVCNGCENKCVTLKALWIFSDGSSSACPQGKAEIYDNDSWDETVEKAYEAHLC